MIAVLFVLLAATTLAAVSQSINVQSINQSINLPIIGLLRIAALKCWIIQ